MDWRKRRVNFVFQILTCLGRDAAQWQSLIDQLPLEYRDVHFTPAYARVQQSLGHPCYAAVYQWQDFFILQPFMQRRGEVVSFYGGGGPISNLIGKADYRLWLWFEQEFAEWRKANKITGEYTRLHPMFEREQRRMLRESTLNIEHLREAVTVRIDTDDDKLLKSFSRNRQRGIKDACQQGAHVEYSSDTELFGILYDESMERLHATDVWKYHKRVWQAYQSQLGNDYLSLFIARLDSTKAMLMVLHGNGKAYAQFIASNGLPNISGISDLLYSVSMKHCRDVGCKTYFMGGGTTSEVDDPLLQYKSGFSKVRVPVYFYKRQFSRECVNADSSEAQPA